MKKMYFCKSGHNYEILALSTFFDKWSMFQIACLPVVAGMKSSIMILQQMLKFIPKKF